eukprot:SAG31_NODE_6240_length_2107_cov_1.253486_3_plen_113_part_00
MQLFEKYGTLIERNTALIEKVSPCRQRSERAIGLVRHEHSSAALVQRWWRRRELQSDLALLSKAYKDSKGKLLATVDDVRETAREEMRTIRAEHAEQLQAVQVIEKFNLNLI